MTREEIESQTKVTIKEDELIIKNIPSSTLFLPFSSFPAPKSRRGLSWDTRPDNSRGEFSSNFKNPSSGFKKWRGRREKERYLTQFFRLVLNCYQGLTSIVYEKKIIVQSHDHKCKKLYSKFSSESIGLRIYLPT